MGERELNPFVDKLSEAEMDEVEAAMTGRPTPSRSAVSEELTVPVDYGRGWYAALDSICHFINALDSSEMTARDVRSAIYGECLEARPKHSRPTPDLGELVEAVRRAIGRLSELEKTRVRESLHAEMERGEKEK